MIRRMEPSDIEAVAEIWLAANLDAHSFIPADYWRANFALSRQRWRRPRSIYMRTQVA